MAGQGGKGGGVVQPGGPVANRSGGGMDFMQPANTGGNGILPPGSLSTSDMGMDGMSTTQRDFIATHGKPFSQMTPEEQFAVQNPVSAPMAPTIPPPMMPQPQQPFNVNNASATGLQNSMGATTNLLNSPIDQSSYANAATTGLGQSLGTTGGLTDGLVNQTGYRNAGTAGLGQSMDTTSNIMSDDLNVDQFNNPYQQQVVDTVQQDIERQRQMAMNNIGAQAQAAGAFGGSRQGVAEGVTNAEFGRMAANALAPLRMQGYNTSVANAMADRSARLGAAGQLGNLANTTLGNAFTDRSQQLGAAGQQGNLANTMLGNVFNARGQQMGAAGQLSNMANQAFNTGRTINQDMANQGLLQQSLQQALIDAARGDFANYGQAPMNSLNAPIAALGAARYPTSTTSTQNPGALGILGALKYIMGPQAAAIPGL
jgi:hypothetical protein